MQLMDRVSDKPKDRGRAEEKVAESVRLIEFTPVIDHNGKPEVLPTFVMHVNDAPIIIRTAEAVISDGPEHVFIAYSSYEQMRLRIPNALGATKKLADAAYSL